MTSLGTYGMETCTRHRHGAWHVHVNHRFKRLWSALNICWDWNSASLVPGSDNLTCARDWQLESYVRKSYPSRCCPRTTKFYTSSLSTSCHRTPRVWPALRCYAIHVPISVSTDEYLIERVGVHVYKLILGGCCGEGVSGFEMIPRMTPTRCLHNNQDNNVFRCVLYWWGLTTRQVPRSDN